MYPVLKVLCCVAALVLAGNVHAQTVPFALPEFLQGCEAQHLPQDCLDRAWKYADVVDDGFLTAAEVGKLVRSLTPNVEINELPVGAAAFANQFANVQQLSSMTALPQIAQLLISDHDYDGDGKLSPQEFRGQFDPTQEQTLAQLIKTTKGMYEFRSLMNNRVKDLKTNEPGEGLSHIDIKARRDVRNGVNFLVVSGKVKNTTQESTSVPALYVSLTDADGNVVETCKLEDFKRLGPEESTPFEVEFENPSGITKNLSLPFSNPSPRQ